MLYLRLFNLIVSTQCGFHPHHSTESILIKMIDDWLEAVDQGLHWCDIFRFTQVLSGLSLRAGGRGFSPATTRVAPGYFYWKIEEK